ncbi:MAG: hypothetical protein J6Q68_02015 [Clostridia bacterium]|nr:hypothetical protein [Clostridia bacterium]
MQQKREENIRKTEETSAAELEIEARVRREIEEKMRAEMDELRRKNEEAELLRKKLDEQKRAEMRERERLAEAARLAVLDKEKREADRRAEEERDRLNAERKAAEEKARLEERRAAEEREAERLRIEAELQEKEPMQEVAESEPKIKYVTKNVSLIFRRGGVDSSMTRRVREIIVATIKYLHKENVYVRIKATVVDSTTLNLTFSELPESEQQLVVDIIQVLGKSNIGVTKAILE